MGYPKAKCTYIRLVSCYFSIPEVFCCSGYYISKEFKFYSSNFLKTYEIQGLFDHYPTRILVKSV